MGSEMCIRDRREELDFGIEARNIAAVAGTSRVRVPAVYGQWSTSRVLVLEHLDGVTVRDAEPVLADSGADRHALARGLLAAIASLGSQASFAGRGC